MTDFTPTLTAATPKHQQIADRFIARLIESETRHTPRRPHGRDQGDGDQPL